MRDDVADLEGEPHSIRHGMHAAVFAAHFVEHVFDHTAAIQAQFRRMADYRTSLEARAPSLKMLRDICNFAKHAKITKYVPQVSKVDVENVVDSDEVSRAIVGITPMSMIDEDLGLMVALKGEPRLLVTLQDGSTDDLLGLLKDAVSFWEHELSALGL